MAKLTANGCTVTKRWVKTDTDESGTTHRELARRSDGVMLRKTKLVKTDGSKLEWGWSKLGKISNPAQADEWAQKNGYVVK